VTLLLCFDDRWKNETTTKGNSRTVQWPQVQNVLSYKHGRPADRHGVGMRGNRRDILILVFFPRDPDARCIVSLLSRLPHAWGPQGEPSVYLALNGTLIYHFSSSHCQPRAAQPAVTRPLASTCSGKWRSEKHYQEASDSPPAAGT